MNILNQFKSLVNYAISYWDAISYFANKHKFFLRNNSISALLRSKQFLWSEIIFFTALNKRSEATESAGMLKYLLATFPKIGYMIFFSFH